MNNKMAKLYFRYGTVNSAKTLNLLSVRHNYISRNRKVLLCKPKIDSRKGDKVFSRIGIEVHTDILIDDNIQIIDIVTIYIKGLKDGELLSCILVDECQFLSKENIKELRYISTFMNIPVICYGLRTNFYGKLFSGSEALFCLADSIEEIKNTCNFCDKKGVMNLKIVNDNNTNEINVNTEIIEKYSSACYEHFIQYTEEQNKK